MTKKENEINTLPVVEDTGGGVVENTSLQQSDNLPKPSKRGRPKGAKNKDTLFKELMTGKFQDIAEVNIQKTFEVLFEQAHEGNMQAIKLIMDRVIPTSKAIDLDKVSASGLKIEVNIGKLEDTVAEARVIEGDFYEEDAYASS